MKKKFSFKQRLRSIRNAFRGILAAVKTQHNLWIHTVAIIAVVIAGFIFKISLVAWGLVVLVIGLVITLEIMNTAIERLVDLISPDYNKEAGLIKDIMAGGVLAAAIIAVIIGLLVFLPGIIG